MPDVAKIYVFRTALRGADVVEALRSSMDQSELDFIFKVNAVGHQSIIGNADESQCHLMRRPSIFSPDYAGIFAANIFQERNGTRLDGEFVKVEFGLLGGSRNRRVGSINSIKFGIVVLIVFEVYNVFGSFLEANHPLINPPAVFAGLFLIASSIWFPLKLRTRRRQREFILNHLKRVLNATMTIGETAP